MTHIMTHARTRRHAQRPKTKHTHTHTYIEAQAQQNTHISHTHTHTLTHPNTHTHTHRGPSSPNGGLTFISPSILYQESATRRALICPPPPPGGVSCLGVPYLGLCPAEHAQGNCINSVALENVPTYQSYSDYAGDECDSICLLIFADLDE
jgi:hypothetical protein